MGRQLDPGFDMAGVARPFLERAMLQRYAPGVLLRRGRRMLAGVVDLVHDLPHDLRRLLRAARRGKLRVHVDVDSLKGFSAQIDRAVSRLTMGVVTAALIVGSSIVLNSAGGVSSTGLRVLGTVGFVGAALGGLCILWSIWRGGR